MKKPNKIKKVKAVVGYMITYRSGDWSVIKRNPIKCAGDKSFYKVTGAVITRVKITVV